MSFSKFTAISALLLMTQSGFAATVSKTEITVIMMDRSKSEKVYIKTSVARPSGSPTCHTNSWTFVLPLVTEAEKAIYAALLSAKSAGKKVNLVGTGECGTYATIETLNRIEVL